MTFSYRSPLFLLKFPILTSPMIALLRLLMTQCDNSDYDDVDEYGDDNDVMTDETYRSV